MKKAIILYRSRTGKTKRLGENIQALLNNHNVVAEIRSIDDANEISILEYDFIFLGCWTNGLMWILQGPDGAWVKFAKKLPELESKKTILFTTFLIRTGSMFKNMGKRLNFIGENNSTLNIESRNGKLDQKNEASLLEFIGRK